MTSPDQATATGYRQLMIAIAAFAVVAYLEAVIFYWCHPLKIGHDQALHLECAKLMLKGELPYVDFIDTNPPLIFYLDAFPAALANWFSAPPPLMFSEWIVFLSLLSFLGSVALVRKYLRVPEFSSLTAILVALPLLNVFFRFDFGQREHIFVILYSPFLLLRWLRWHNQNPSQLGSMLAGMAAAIGVCLKPFFVLPVLAIELFWLIEKRRIKPLLAPEITAFALTFFAYLVHFFFFPIESQKAYFGFILPALTGGYAFFDISTIGQLGLEQFKQVFGLTSLVCFVALILRNKSSLLLPLAAFTISSLPIYLLQNKGWTYHAMPFFAGAMYLACLEAWIALDNLAKSKWLTRIKGLKNFGSSYQIQVSAIVCSMILFGWFCARELASYLAQVKIPLEVLGWKGSCPTADISAPNISQIVILRSSPGDSILFFSNAVWPAFPLTVQLNRKPGSRHLHSCLLSMLEFIRTKNESSELLKYENQMIEEYVTDINANKPKLVFVQITPVEQYLQAYDFEKKYLSEYMRMADVENFRVYTRRGG